MLKSLRPLILVLTLAWLPSLHAQDTIKIGEVAALTGKDASFGQSSHKATVLAIEEINAAGGVLGKKLELITENNQCKIGESATAAKKLISRDKVIALLGEVASSRSLEMAPVAQAAKIPMISPSSTNPKVTQVGNYIFRVCFIDPFQGSVMAKFTRDTLKLEKVAILSSVSSAYSVGLAAAFKSEFIAAGGKIVIEQRFSEGDKDFKAQLTAIKAAGVDGILIPAYYTECALIALQARALGLDVPLFGGDGWESPQLIAIGGKAVEGIFFSTHYSSENPAPATQAFVKKYREKYGETPDGLAALGYDSVLVLVDALKRAGTTNSAKLRDALAATREVMGATGSTTLDAQRNATKPAAIFTVKEGKFQYVQSAAP
jgi:branched-chain amino acid transport system substrate-binding protein